MDMLEEIKLFGRKRLRKTSIRRSLGGTPIKDLAALENKIPENSVFANVQVRESESESESQEDQSDSNFD